MITTLTEADLPFLLELSQEAGWDHTEADWRTLLATGEFFGHKDDHGTVLSCCAVFDFGRQLASLGMLLVREKYRRLGLATQLMEHALQSCPHEDRPIMLCAAASAEGFYKKFGFTTVEHLVKMKCPGPVRLEPSPMLDKVDLLPITEDDLTRVVHLDWQVTGGERGPLWQARLRQAQHSSLLMKKGEHTLMGFGLAVQQGKQRLLGPVIGFNRHSAIDLIRELLQDHSGPVRIDVFQQRRDLIEVLKQAGFQEVDTQAVMRTDTGPLPGRRDHLFAPVMQAWG
jgi:GNAT superfamily N-acetyltransferase